MKLSVTEASASRRAKGTYGTASWSKIVFKGTARPPITKYLKQCESVEINHWETS